MEPKAIVANVRSIFSLPDVVFKINELINSGKSSNNELEQVILNDPGLTAKILRFSNSAYFGFSRKIDTISHAIALIGHNELRNLVLASSVTTVFKGVSSDVFDMESFWHHSVCTGVVARLLAYNVDCRERMFIAGLLHGIGKLILLSQFPEQAIKILDTDNQDDDTVIKTEREVFDFTSAELGAEFLNAWDLPKSIWQIVNSQLTPLSETYFKTDACILYVAIKIATYKQQHPEKEIDGAEIETLCNPAVWDFLGLNDEIIELLNTVADLQIQEMFHYIKPDSD